MAAPPRTNASPHWTARPALAQWEGGMLPGGAEPRARGSGSSPGEVESGETGARLPQRPPQDWRSGAVVSARGPSRGTAWSRPGSCDHDAAAGSEALETQAWGRQGPADTPQPNKGRGGQKRRSAAKKFVRWASMSVRWTPKAARSPVVGWGAARKPCRATRLLRGRAGTLGPFQISAGVFTGPVTCRDSKQPLFRVPSWMTRSHSKAVRRRQRSRGEEPAEKPVRPGAVSGTGQEGATMAAASAPCPAGGSGVLTAAGAVPAGRGPRAPARLPASPLRVPLVTCCSVNTSFRETARAPKCSPGTSHPELVKE
ncbi:uncharacterized protein [Callorhinus ursinus]|uniref:uncharacterized protein isoform X2 n=1 Tax=Callorhinus ursinus TaxID=34884 RepID=UPI003CD01F43